MLSLIFLKSNFWHRDKIVIGTLSIFVVANIGCLVLSFISFPNLHYVFLFIGIAFVCAGIGKLVYPTSKIIYYMFRIEITLFFWFAIAIYYFIKRLLLMLADRC